MDGGNLAARSVEIAVSVKLRARGSRLVAARPRCVAAGVDPCEPASNYSGLMLSGALCIADIDRGGTFRCARAAAYSLLRDGAVPI